MKNNLKLNDTYLRNIINNNIEDIDKTFCLCFGMYFAYKLIDKAIDNNYTCNFSSEKVSCVVQPAK